MKKIVTDSARETKELGKLLAQKLRGGEVLCLDGELGAGKTTFTQGLLQGLKIKGPYTSPTFVIMKEYRTKKITVYHIDAYRIESEDLMALGWKEIIADTKNVVIIEWSNRVKKILPKRALKIAFIWLDKNKRQITFA